MIITTTHNFKEGRFVSFHLQQRCQLIFRHFDVVDHGSNAGSFGIGICPSDKIYRTCDLEKNNMCILTIFAMSFTFSIVLDTAYINRYIVAVEFVKTL